jgi:hypothetical protein
VRPRNLTFYPGVRWSSDADLCVEFDLNPLGFQSELHSTPEAVDGAAGDDDRRENVTAVGGEYCLNDSRNCEPCLSHSRHVRRKARATDQSRDRMFGWA